MVLNFGATLLIVLAVAAFPLVVSAGMYTTTLPSGEVTSPITATFNIQDFSEKDYPLPGTGCNSSYAPAEVRYYYYYNAALDFASVLGSFTPTAEEISSGIYSDTFDLPVGTEVWSIEAEFFSAPGGGGTRCGFYGNQPNGVPVSWDAPIFKVVEPPAVIARTAVRNNAPTVGFTDFPAEATWFGKKAIKYSARDPDGPPYNLKDLPMSFYLSSDGGSFWLEIAKGVDDTGEFVLDTASFPDGNRYKLKIVAADNAGLTGEIVSDVFGIDNSSPTFKVAVAGDLIKETDKVKITITSSEDLRQTPEVSVTQNGAEPQALAVTGARKDFSVSYTVTRGFPGNAAVSVKGTDLAGNQGTKITAGETFFVHRFGPPPPAVKNLADNESLSVPEFGVLGNAADAETVTLVLNDKEKFTARPDGEGNFSFKDLKLSGANLGLNTLKISSVDRAGVESLERTIRLKLNSPPEISWVSQPAGTVLGAAKLEWRASDANEDPLVFEISYSVDDGKTWDSLARGVTEQKYILDSGGFFDAGYRLKVEANDGSARAEISSGSFSIRNGNSLSLNIPSGLLVDTDTPTFEGRVTLTQGKIASLRYSLDKEVWTSARASEGGFDSASERFSVEFSDPLLDGKHLLHTEARDDQDRVYRTFRPFIIDTRPPIPPKLPLCRRI